MAEKPILMCGEMVRAVLDWSKTQTRRVMKPQPILSRNNPPKFSDTKPGDLFIAPDLFPSSGMSSVGGQSDSFVFVLCESIGTYRCLGKTNLCDEFCPYGQPGDRLWVRETFHLGNGGSVCIYRANYEGCDPFNNDECGEDCSLVGEKWKPSIFMPRWASRITLEITDVRVERVQSITPEDAIAEGIYPKDIGRNWAGIKEPVATYKDLWDSLNKARGFGWDSNPWVWAITFKRIKT